jgi:hypothetical protein
MNTRPSKLHSPRRPEDRLAIAAGRDILAERIAEADAGEVVEHADVRRWLLSWGTPDESQLLSKILLSGTP